jgi:nicotinate-nucleotide adenylyltransferase
MLEKIGIFGGTFDPVHKGHLELSKTAINSLKLDKLYIIPNGTPPHKPSYLNKEHRFKMLEDVFSHQAKTIVSDFEINKEAYSYSYQTIQHFKEIHPNSKLFFIIGMDNLKEISNWKNPEIIFELSTIAIFDRVGFSLDNSLINKLENEYKAKIRLFPFEYKISSTKVKEKIGSGEYIFYDLDINTFSYIIKNGLYGNDNVSEYSFYEKELLKFVDEKRYKHSIGVACTAYLLAKRYNEDTKLAYFTGLVHDIAKRLPIETQLEYCKKIKLDPQEIEYPKMLHSPAGAGLLKKEYKIKDKKLLQAVRLHTIGDKNMTLFDKIIYMADYIEPYREFDGLEELRELAFLDINKAILKGIDTTILSLITENLRISPILLTVRNELLEGEKKL